LGSKEEEKSTVTHRSLIVSKLLGESS